MEKSFIWKIFVGVLDIDEGRKSIECSKIQNWSSRTLQLEFIMDTNLKYQHFLFFSCLCNIACTRKIPCSFSKQDNNTRNERKSRYNKSSLARNTVYLNIPTRQYVLTEPNFDPLNAPTILLTDHTWSGGHYTHSLIYCFREFIFHVLFTAFWKPMVNGNRSQKVSRLSFLDSPLFIFCWFTVAHFIANCSVCLSSSHIPSRLSSLLQVLNFNIPSISQKFFSKTTV